jgi:hypothetical protein
MHKLVNVAILREQQAWQLCYSHEMPATPKKQRGTGSNMAMNCRNATTPPPLRSWRLFPAACCLRSLWDASSSLTKQLDNRHRSWTPLFYGSLGRDSNDQSSPYRDASHSLSQYHWLRQRNLAIVLLHWVRKRQHLQAATWHIDLAHLALFTRVAAEEMQHSWICWPLELNMQNHDIEKRFCFFSILI